MSDLPKPVTDRSPRAEMWDEICAMGGEIDAQQREVAAARQALLEKDAELAALRQKLEGAYLRLNVIQAALAHPGA